MLDGMPLLLAQIAAPMAASTAFGALVGWLIGSGWDRRQHARRSVRADHLATAEELAAALQSVQTLQTEVSRVRDQKDTELGRLETHAIQAMETTMTLSESRIKELEQELADARSALRRTEDDLTTQRGQTERLRRALAERDLRISKMAGDR